MPTSQVPESLSKGVIDGAVVPWEVTTALKVPELVSNHTEFGENESVYTATFVLAMNRARYESLPDDLKKVIDDNSGREVSGLFGKIQQEWDSPGRKIAVERKNNIITLSADQVAKWKAAAQPVVDRWIAEMNEKGRSIRRRPKGFTRSWACS